MKSMIKSSTSIDGVAYDVNYFPNCITFKLRGAKEKSGDFLMSLWFMPKAIKLPEDRIYVLETTNFVLNNGEFISARLGRKQYEDTPWQDYVSVDLMKVSSSKYFFGKVLREYHQNNPNIVESEPLERRVAHSTRG